MRDKTGTETGSSRPSPLVLVTDPSVEGATLVHALRALGLRVLDVPVALLAGALAADRVAAIVVDVDQPGAAATIQAALDRPESGDPRVFVIGDGEGAAAAGRALEAIAVFSRPIDVDAIAGRVADLEPVEARFGARSSQSVAPRRETLRPDEGEASDLPPPLDLEGPSLLGQADDDAALLFEHESIHVSPDLEAVLEQAAERARLGLSLVPSSSEHDGDVVLSPQQVELLDEPLDGEDDDPRPLRTTSGPLSSLPPLRAEHTAPHDRGTAPTGPPERDAAPHDLPPPRSREAPTLPPADPRGAEAPVDAPPPPPLPQEAREPRVVEPRVVEPHAAEPPWAEAARRPSHGGRERGPASLEFPAPSLTKPDLSTPEPRAATPPQGPPASGGRAGGAYGEGDAAKLVASAIAARRSGCLSLEAHEEGARVLRRLVLHEGDLVTAISEAPSEAIVPFLAGRGDLPRALVPALDRRIPPFGRLAGAALIAQGHLGQDDLWVVLRAHAEWVLARLLASPGGAIQQEDAAPGRLAQEPNVFGGATGSEVFLENLRRALDPARALAWLGGREARVTRGPRPELLVECALAPDEAELVESSAGARLGELAQGRETELAPLFYGLACLGVVEVLAPARREPERPSAQHDPLDDEAIRKRVEARLALALEGDYFAVLGVPRDATAYEIKRRYLELRRAFEPSRLLTPATADLAADVTLVLEVLDEAYDVLREPYRRERYRRALDAGPP